MTIRIGSVPYLNAKPMVDWFHTSECDADAEVIYTVPSALAVMLQEGTIDVANVSSFEGFRNPNLVIVPDISISAQAAVKSVRLFCSCPPDQLRTVALDTSSLTSAALTQILLHEEFGCTPEYRHHAPNLDAMLAECDAGLIIGDLKLFDLRPGTTVYDLGDAWRRLTGLPFVYATWQARADRVSVEMVRALTAARDWGEQRLETIADAWAPRLDLPLDRCRDYLLNVMDYHLRPDQQAGLALFQQKCFAHGLISEMLPLRVWK
jgi:chorismate dehydratase